MAIRAVRANGVGRDAGARNRNDLFIASKVGSSCPRDRGLRAAQIVSRVQKSLRRLG